MIDRGRKLVVVLLAVMTLAAPGVRAATAAPNTKFQEWTNKQVAEWHDKIDQWRLVGRVVLGLTLFTGLVGIGVAALQTAKQKRFRAAVAIGGVAISVSTLVKTQVFEYDHHAYLNAAGAAEKLVHKMARWSSYPFTNDAELQEASGEVRGLLRQLEQIESRLAPSGGESSATGSDLQAGLLEFLEPAVFAQGSLEKPKWLRGVPADASTIFFVGSATNQDLSAAKRESRDNAIVAAREAITASLPVAEGYDPARLAAYLAEAGSVSDVFFERTAEGYRYYTLFAVAKRSMRVDTKLFALSERATVPSSAVEAAANAKPLGVDYGARRQRSYETATAHARSQVSAEAYRLYETGRSSRLRGDIKAATTSLSAAVNLAPSFYMAWYNLGLAHEAANRPVEAETAYRQAIALEPTQPVRDGSVYNTYGWLLFRQRKYEQAKMLFQQSLAIDGSNPMAARNLAAVEKLVGGR